MSESIATSIKFSPENLMECLKFCGNNNAEYTYRNIAAGPPYGEVITVQTEEGPVMAEPGDWIVRRAHGELIVLRSSKS